jgi:hypothetical protein
MSTGSDHDEHRRPSWGIAPADRRCSRRISSAKYSLHRLGGFVLIDELALTYGRSYRLTRALLDPGPGRLKVRGRYTRVVDTLGASDKQALHELLAEPDSTILSILDPRPTIRIAGAIQNTYALSLLQAETLAAAVANDWPIRFLDADSATVAVGRAATELGLHLDVIPQAPPETGRP